MKIRTKVNLTLLAIIALVAAAATIDYPTGPNIQLGNYSKEIKLHLGLDLQGGTSLLYNADVSVIPDADRQDSLTGVKDVIERRINAFGVGEPNIQTVRSGDDYRLLVELPGITDITEAVNRIGATPVLEFKTEGELPAYTDEEITAIRTRNDAVKPQAQAVLDRALTGEKFADLATEFSQDPGSKDKGGDLGSITRGQTVPEFDSVVFDKATVGDVFPELVKSDFGYHIILVKDRTVADPAVEGSQDTATVRHILLSIESETPQQLGPNYQDTGLTGEQLDRADVVLDPTTGFPTVSISFNSEGKDLFAQITRDHVNETVAIYLDGSIISAPTVQQEISTGEAVISGNFDLAEAKELAQRLNAGALPVPIELISQQNIGPTLGQTAVERSVFAGAIGVLALIIFLIVYYRLPGVLAAVSLGCYFLLVLAIFKLLPVTLTLAGIAGFILSIGMAVDANVLIFERMKEELRSGKPIRKAIDDGFARAWTSIRDSNTTSLITCVILYWFGSSVIRGFAITLAIGIVVSIFSAITITRTFLLLTRTNNTWWYGVPKRSTDTPE